MRIISKFHDFYDSIQYQYGSDSNVWERKTHVDDENLVTDWSLRPKSRDTVEHKNSFDRYGYGIISIGDITIASYYVMSLKETDGISHSTFEFFDDENDLKNRIGSEHMWFRFFQKHHGQSDYEDNLAEKFVKSYRDKTNEPIFSTFPMEHKKTTGNASDWFSNIFPNGSIIINPPLHPIINLIKHTMGNNFETKVYNAIEEYVMARNLETIPEITDNNQKIDSHGFDRKISFRN